MHFRWYLLSVMMDHYFKLNHMIRTTWILLIWFQTLHQFCHSSVFYLALETYHLGYSGESPFLSLVPLNSPSSCFGLALPLFCLSEISPHASSG